MRIFPDLPVNLIDRSETATMSCSTERGFNDIHANVRIDTQGETSG
jgi:hypothetical protein